MSTPLEFPVGRQLGLLVSDLARLFRKRFEHVAKARQLGLTRAQAAVLIHLARQEGIKQVALAQLMELEPITVVRLLDRLEALALVERRPDPQDRRAHILYLRDGARPLLSRINDVGEVVREEAMATLDKQQRELLFDTLWTMKANLIERLADARVCSVENSSNEPERSVAGG